MKQSVYVLTALFAGITAGVFAAGWSGSPKFASGQGAEAPTPEPLETRGVLATRLARIETHQTDSAGTSEILDRLLKEVERAALERQALTERHEALQVQMERIEEKLAFAVVDGVGASQTPPRESALEASQTSPSTAQPEDPELQALLDAGFDTYEVADIRRRAGEAEMERLYLRDRAIREGYFRTERYQDELDALESPESLLRAQLGEEALDRYLFASGERNRIRIQSVIDASPAAAAGMQAGDIIYRYGGRRIFSTSDLRTAMMSGNAGESVSVEVTRDGSRRSFYVIRGPLGVRLSPARIEP